MDFLEVAGEEGMTVFGLAGSTASRMYWRSSCGLTKGGGNPAFSFHHIPILQKSPVLEAWLP